MQRLFLLCSLLLACAWAAGLATFSARDVVIRNRPFIQGNIEAKNFYYNKGQKRIGWEYEDNTAGSLSEAYRYDEDIRLRKCADSCEAFGEDRNVPDLVSKGPANGNLNGCGCFNENPTAANGQVTRLCFKGNNICYVEFSSGESWTFDDTKITSGTSQTPSDAYLESIAGQNSGCIDSCAQAFDIVLVLDESGSIDGNEWNDLRNFAIQLVNSFKIGPNDANFAIKLYSDNARNLQTMSSNKNSILNQLRNINKRNGFTCIGCGIQLANNELQANARPGIPNLIVTLTDGRNNRPSSNPRGHLTTHTNTARNRGYKMISIGVGNNLSQDDLKLFTSVWPQDHILVADFSKLKEKLNDILTVICPVNKDNDCGSSCKGICHCGKECVCPICEAKDKCHVAECNKNAGNACVQKPKNCDDGNLCTRDTCNPNTGCVHTDISNTCDSNSDCITDRCDPAVGCRTTPVTCPSNDKCIERSCTNPGGCMDTIVTNATCRSRAPSNTRNDCWEHWCDDGCKRARKDCDFGDKCKVYSCANNGGCREVDRDCDKGDPCKIYGCDSKIGCTERPKVCNDNQVCTTDTCNPMTGVCEFNRAASCTACQYLNGDDVNCTVVRASDLAADMCQEAYCDLAGMDSNPDNNCRLRDTKSKCDTANMCVNSVCNVQTGECDVTPVVCDSQNACIIDSCEPSIGCNTTARVCEARSECEIATCDPMTGCVYTPKQCDFGDPCKIYSCDPSKGCQEEIKCKPINNCFNNTCIPTNGTCVAIDLCDDGNECTIDTCDLSVPGGQCVKEDINVTEVCEDFNGCTTDFCDPAVGCVNEYNECPNVNDTLICKVASECHPLLGCRIGNFDCPPIDDCHISECVYVNATATDDAKNTCSNTKVDNVLCTLGTGGVTGLSIGAGVLAVIIIAVIVALVLASLAAAKAFQVLTADGLASGGAQNSAIYDQGAGSGTSAIFS